MMTIREYFAAEERWEEEVEVYERWQDEELDLDAWAAERGIDLEARDEQAGEYVLTLWAWDMCGD